MGKKENGIVCNCFCSSITQEINCCRGEKKRKKLSLNLQSRIEPIKALHCFERQPPLLSLFPLLLISPDNSQNTNSSASSRVISLQTTAEKIEIISLWLVEPRIEVPTKHLLWAVPGPSLGCLMCRRTEGMRPGNLVWAQLCAWD